MWNDLQYTVFDTRTLDGFRGAVDNGCVPELYFLQLALAQVLVGLRKQLINTFVFLSWACAAGSNNNDTYDSPLESG